MDTTDTPRFEAMTTGTLLDRAFRLYTNNFSLMLASPPWPTCRFI